MNRKLLWAVFGIGLVLAVAPFALLLPTKASAGEDRTHGRDARDESPQADPSVLEVAEEA